jgi:hypothetical protein
LIQKKRIEGRIMGGGRIMRREGKTTVKSSIVMILPPIILPFSEFQAFLAPSSAIKSPYQDFFPEPAEAGSEPAMVSY